MVTRATREEPRGCQSCGEKFLAEIVVVQYGSRITEYGGKECPACREATDSRERAQEEQVREGQRVQLREDFRRRCGLPPKFQAKNFENFEGTPKAFEVAKRYAEEFPVEDPRGCPSLILHSPVNGVGKSHLAAAVANRIIERWRGDPNLGPGSPVLYLTAPALLLRVRSTYDRKDQLWHETEEDVYRELRGVPLLIVDDVGKEAPSEHTQRVYFHIIDERYGHELPVLIVSNLNMDELVHLMGRAVVSRLAEMAQGQVVKVSGRDYRYSKINPSVE